MKTMNLMFIVDDNYVDQLKVTLYSIAHNVDNREVHVYLAQKSALARENELAEYCGKLGFTFHPIVVGDDVFKDAPTTDRYPDTIYYRLLAHEFLPENLEKVLYLDADIICLNGFEDFYDTDLQGNLYAAASHIPDSGTLDLINKLRLQNYEMDSAYFNTGVLLMNLNEIRHVVKREDILNYIAQNYTKLILPDQDVLNGLYADKVVPIPDEIYNFDARYSVLYQAKSNNEWTLDWVISHTVFLHFAGRDKPWNPTYRSRYAALYKYMDRRARAL